MEKVEEISGWLLRLNIGMWLLAGGVSLVQILRAPGPFSWECLAWTAAAHGLCLGSFLYAQRAGSRVRGSGWPVLAAMAVQLLLVLLLAAWWRGLFGGLLLVLTAWQAALAWPLRRSLLWVAVQTTLLTLVALRNPDPPTAVAMAAVIGGLQALAALAAHSTRCESEARLALARTHAELREAHELLLRGGQAAERMRLARELHDGMGHQLTALSLDLEAALHQAEGPARQSVARARSLAGGLLSELRQVVGHLREEGAIDLGASLASLTASVREPRIHLAVRGPVGAVDAVRAHAVVRCTQELITNVIKHASARNLWIELGVEEAALTLGVTDDGRGAPGIREGYGLRGIRERVSQLGGRLEIISAAPGFGAQVWLPRGGATA